MKKAIIKSEGNNYSAIEIGKFNDINQYSFPHPKLEKDIPGKLFISELIKSTGTEISIQALPPNGKRTWRNKSDDSMLLVVIQAKAESLQNYYVSDGFNANGQILR